MSKTKSGKPTKAAAQAQAATSYRPLAERLREMIQDEIGSGRTTLSALAVAAGIPHPVLHRFYTGTRDNLRLDTADKLCAHFGVRLTAPRKTRLRAE